MAARPGGARPRCSNTGNLFVDLYLVCRCDHECFDFLQFCVFIIVLCDVNNQKIGCGLWRAGRSPVGELQSTVAANTTLVYVTASTAGPREFRFRVQHSTAHTDRVTRSRGTQLHRGADPAGLVVLDVVGGVVVDWQ
jgi:hypothetical protein